MANCFVKWFTDLVKDLGPEMANTFFPEFLRFIQKKMLHPDRMRRTECKTAEDFLEECLKHPPESSYWRFNGTVPYQNVHSWSTTGTGTW